MAKINRLIPFSWWPANWGLTGSRRARAHAEYYLDGEDLAYRLLDIEYPELSDKEETWAQEYRTDKLKLDYRYHKIGEFDYGLGLIENNPKLTINDRAREIAKYRHRFGKITSEELEYKLLDLSYEVKDTEAFNRDKLKLDVRFGKKTQEQADRELLDLKYPDKDVVEYKKEVLQLERKHGKISQNELEKQTATLDEEPWFNFLGADKRITGDTVRAAVELDWNEYFPPYLISQGWTGATDDEIVDKWFEAMMRDMLNIADDQVIDDGSEDPLPLASKVQRDDGLTEYR